MSVPPATNQQSPGGYPQYNPGPPQNSPKNGLGIAALVLGLVGIALAFIPFVGLFLSIPLGLIGAVLAIFGLVRVSKGVATNKVMSIFGLVTSILAIVIAITSSVATGAFIGAVAESVESGSSSDGAAMDEQGEGSAVENEQFPGQQESDIVGQAGDTLEARGVVVTAGALEEESDDFGTYLCSNVKYENNGDERLSYNTMDWSLQEPGGNIQMTTIMGGDEELSAGELAPGGSTEGLVCFETTDATGTHVLLFEGFLSLDTSRAVWINEL
ncbi:hypothetical protein GCM10022261_17580 [Brevibacterium daeguense]|uniref:DUF4352 domain-containing protein n=1 Tax=Brevibacterium daeguense TaxID=909936 RepID=A0ABP8EK89_9MICO|nr:DUF4190 domain-containing protein [Brevibacterium daeguense]